MPYYSYLDSSKDTSRPLIPHIIYELEGLTDRWRGLCLYDDFPQRPTKIRGVVTPLHTYIVRMYLHITYFAYFYPGRTDPGLTLSMSVDSVGCCLTCPILSVTLSPLNHLNQQQNLSGAQEWKLPGSRQD